MRIISAIVLVLLAVAAFSSADHGRTEIGPTDTFPIVIGTPGSYVLTADLHLTDGGTGTAMIEINADNVTLDLGGHVLKGPGENSNGLAVFGEGRTGVTIHGGSITDFGTGVSFLDGSSGTGVNRFHELVISNIGWGSGLGFSGGTAHDVVVTGVSTTNFVSEAVSCSECTLQNVIVRSSYKAFHIRDGSAVNCTATDNELGFTLSNASLTGGAANNNSGIGIYAVFRSTLVGVTVSDNGAWGILLESDGGNNVVNCTGGNNTSGNVSGCGDGNGCHQNYLP